MIRYEDSLKYYRDLKNVLDTALGEGVEKGIGIGREQGIDIGRAREKMDTAAKMLARGLDLQSVMEITGLSREDIEKLG